MATPDPVALFDSGEGGLTVLRHLVERFPGEHFIYAADSAHFPYGDKSLDTVRDWFLAFLQFFVTQGARAVVIACNTATAAALDAARDAVDIPVFGVVEPAAVRAARITGNGHVGVLSTLGTFNSGLYPQFLTRQNPDLQVVAKPCPILVTMAENGTVRGASVEQEVRQCVTPVLEQGVDTIILGCTHFPHMREVFNHVVDGQAVIVDPGEEAADLLEQELGLAPQRSSVSEVQAWTSGDPIRFRAIAHLLCPNIPLRAHPLIWNSGAVTEPENENLTEFDATDDNS
jgi:glutamate racemase